MKWLVATLLLLAISLLLGLSQLTFALYVLLGVILLSRWMTSQWSGHLAAQRRCSARQVDVGGKVAVVVELENRGRYRVLWTLLEDLLPRTALIHRPPQLEVHGERIRLVTIPAGGTARLLYQLICHRRGYYQLGPLVVETGDLFGLHRRYHVASHPDFLTVYPPVVPLSGYDIASRRPVGEVRVTHRLFEDPTRHAGVRRYEPGDPLRSVHWRATARTGQLQCKVYEPSTVAGATLLLDFHQDSFPIQHEPVRGELVVTACASLAQALFQMGKQVGLITNGRDAADRIRQEGWEYDLRTRQAALAAASMDQTSDRLQPQIIAAGRGPAQPLQIRETLARIEKTDGFRLPELIAETLGHFRRDATVLALLTTVRDVDAIALGTLRRHGFAVSAIINVFDPNDFADASRPLLGEGVPTYQLTDENSVSDVARALQLNYRI